VGDAKTQESGWQLWRFGCGPGSAALRISVRGHEEVEGHTWYIIDSHIHQSYVQPQPQDGEEVQPQSPTEIHWSTKKRLCDLREELHSNVKELMGPAYAAYFDSSPFARLGGPPGTTARLRAWLTNLAHCANEGALSACIQAYVLQFLEAPAPDESAATLIQAVRRCSACHTFVEVVGRDLCLNCQAQLSDEAATSEVKADCKEGEC